MDKINWGYGFYSLPIAQWEKLVTIVNVKKGNSEKTKIQDFINPNFTAAYTEEDDSEAKRLRFDSIIEFRFFLLHVLKVFVKLKTGEKKYLEELLDDKKLLDAFENVMENGVDTNKDVAENRESFSKEFLVCLLRLRFLFDKFIIKREYINDSADGEWSLKELNVSGQQSQKKAYYARTDFRYKGEWQSTNDQRNKEILMLQAAMRVSYTSPKIMHWITELLYWLAADNFKNLAYHEIYKYKAFAEKFIIANVKKDFLDQDKYLTMGVDTPHIVFNYLDYLIWNKQRVKYREFNFEFRNSVEHWYPQNPTDFAKWNDVDRFGNLCIIQRSVNSKFSNLSPDAKKANYKDMIAKGSLKLRQMSELTCEADGVAGRIRWTEEECGKHEAAMLALLKERVNAVGL